MKQRICIGIQKLDDTWTSILNQIGVWFEEVDYTQDLSEHYSVIIVNERPDPEHSKPLHLYLKNSGALVEMKGMHPFLHPHLIARKEASVLFKNTHNGAFDHIPALDIHSEVELHKESKLFQGLIHFQVWKKGLIGFFGADLAALTNHTGYQRKRFFGENDSPPDEIVSTVSKQELIQAFTVVLKELHFRRAIPFVQKWTSPEDEPVFGFRIDTDFGDPHSIRSLYKVLHQHSIKATWFLHVAAHEDWLAEFKAFKDQELALHGYSHGTSKAISKARQNIQTGLDVLLENDISVEGFCAPYGIWNKALERALADFDFQYTSEFTFVYDGAPLQPSTSSPLQMPVHPICTGSLSRRRYSKAQMAAYFGHILKKKLGRHEPVLFYHHPLQPGLEVWDHIFEQINGIGLTNLTFKAFADFWKERETTSFASYFENEKLSIETDNPSIFFQVARDHNGFRLQRPNTTIETQDTNDFEYANTYLPETEIARQLHRKDFKLMKTSLLDWKNRKRL